MVESLKPFLSQLKSLISSPQTKLQFLFLIIGILVIAAGFFIKSQESNKSPSIEIVSDESSVNNQNKSTEKLVVDVRGAILNPGVYYLDKESRVDDALKASGGLTDDANIAWIDKNLNSAAKLIDGQKIYIPSQSEESINQQSTILSATTTDQNMNVAQSNNSQTSSVININSASLNELDALPGIGPVYGQKIIDHRPYSTPEELVSKGAIKQSTFEKLKDMITVF